MTGLSRLDAGDRVPFIFGAFCTGEFFSVEDFAGQTLILLAAEGSGADVQAEWLGAIQARAGEIAHADAAAVMLLSMNAPTMADHINPPTPGVAIAQPGADLSVFGGDGPSPNVLVIDRASRVAEIIREDEPAKAVSAALEAARRLMAPESRRRFSAAPVLIVPNLLDPTLRRQLIDAFEGGDHQEGAMASIDADGKPLVKLQQAKKRRRDFVLGHDHVLYPSVVAALSERLVPEIKRAYQIDIAHADRILIARYDDTGGYFNRHRDNSAPHVAFRQFAVSLNLNTGEYEGGDLEFPEFDNDHYSPPAGAAVVFSATLLHAARPVLKGSRYVLLTFLHDAQAELRRLQLEAA
jgi:predicted 2-oxoglutarate/Fe(II)-dependent dioxygenase YbiX